MAREPTRLLESDELSASERGLLEAALAQPPIHFDVSKGAARFRARRAALSAPQPNRSTLEAIAKRVLWLAPIAGFFTGLYLLLSPLPDAPAHPKTNAMQADENSVRAAVSNAHVETHSAQPEKAEPIQRPQPAQNPRKRASRETAAPHPTLDGARTVNASAKRAASAGSRAPRRPESTLTPTLASPSPPPAQPPTAPIVQDGAAPPAMTTVEAIDELRATARARGLLMSDPRAALALLDRITRAHPKGYLVEERDALRVLALSSAGQRDQAERLAAAFLRAHPDSPFADRIRAVADR